jgi:hypothetical protein
MGNGLTSDGRRLVVARRKSRCRNDPAELVKRVDAVWRPFAGRDIR